MTSAGGQWIRVLFADGAQRLDWIPDDQPPSPDGTAGRWHVVPDPTGGDSRWEWHPRLVARVETAVAEPDPWVTQPLPLQVVPNRRPSTSAPSVFAAPRRSGGIRPPVRMRWAAWSLSVVLAVPVVLLLIRHSDTNDGASPTASQAELNPDSDAALGATTTSATTGSRPSDASVARYLAHLYNLDATQGYTFASFGDDSLVSIGTAACGAMDQGATYDATRESVMAQIPNGGQVVLAAAATYLCPQHHGKLQDYTAKQMADSAGTAASGDVAVG